MEESSPVRVLYATPESDRDGLAAALDATRGFEVRTATSDGVAERSVDVGRFDCAVCASGG